MTPPPPTRRSRHREERPIPLARTMTKSRATSDESAPPGTAPARPRGGAHAAARRRLPSIVTAWAAFVALAAMLRAARRRRTGARQDLHRRLEQPLGAPARIDWVTNQGPAGDRLLDDYSGGLFKPDRHITRAQLARAVVIASGHHDDQVDPVEIADVPADHPYYHDIQRRPEARPDGRLRGRVPSRRRRRPAWQVDRAVVRCRQAEEPRRPTGACYGACARRKWEPNEGWKTERARRYFAFRGRGALPRVSLQPPGLRPTARRPRRASRSTATRSPTSSTRRCTRAAWRSAVWRRSTTSPSPAHERDRRRSSRFACKYIGYPYVWGGEYPTKDSPYGTQAHGGFDCSGFVWWVLKMHFGYTINERVAADMAAAAPRAHHARQPGARRHHLLGPQRTQVDGRVDLPHRHLPGEGLVHPLDRARPTASAWPRSTGTGWSWKTDFAWGRRVLKKSQITLPTAASAAPTWRRRRSSRCPIAADRRSRGARTPCAADRAPVVSALLHSTLRKSAVRQFAGGLVVSLRQSSQSVCSSRDALSASWRWRRWSSRPRAPAALRRRSSTRPRCVSSEPADGAALAAPPATVVLHYSEPLAASPAPTAALTGGPLVCRGQVAGQRRGRHAAGRVHAAQQLAR